MKKLITLVSLAASALLVIGTAGCNDSSSSDDTRPTDASGSKANAPSGDAFAKPVAASETSAATISSSQEGSGTKTNVPAGASSSKPAEGSGLK